MQGRDKEVSEGEDVETVLRGFISALGSATQPAPGPTTDNSHTHAGAVFAQMIHAVRDPSSPASHPRWFPG